MQYWGGESKPLLMSLNEQVSLGHALHKLRMVLYGLTGLSVCTCGHPFSNCSAQFPAMEECSLRMCLTINRGLFQYVHCFSIYTVNTEDRGAGFLLVRQGDADAERLF